VRNHFGHGAKGNMANRRLYVVHGLGSDAVGLVKSLSFPIAQARGNIVDIRQDVLHGLFTFVAVVDLSDSELRIDAFRAMVARIAEDTGLTITVDNYNPHPRDAQRRDILLILVGRDAPGIIAETADLLSRYRINIESSRTVARQGVFLMELLCDMQRCAIPQDLLMADLKEAMAARSLQAIFQVHDAFNKQKRVVLFDIAGSFLDQESIDEILRHSGISADDALSVWVTGSPNERIRRAASKLDGVETEVLESIIKTIRPTDGTVELVQTLKVLGYRIALASLGFSLFTDAARQIIGIDHAFGVSLNIDEDRRIVVGQLDNSAVSAVERHKVVSALVNREQIAESDVTVLSDQGLEAVPGIQLDFDLATILSHHKRHILSSDALMGFVGAFGLVRHASR
jgi:predicted amino acid-binding ACT domain protein/phosphoserine phosphatase